MFIVLELSVLPCRVYMSISQTDNEFKLCTEKMILADCASIHGQLKDMEQEDRDGCSTNQIGYNEFIFRSWFPKPVFTPKRGAEITSKLYYLASMIADQSGVDANSTFGQNTLFKITEHLATRYYESLVKISKNYKKDSSE